MRCIVCKKEIQSVYYLTSVWIQIHGKGKMVEIPKRRFGSPILDRTDKVCEPFFVCATRSTDPVGDRCVDKLERGEFE